MTDKYVIVAKESEIDPQFFEITLWESLKHIHPFSVRMGWHKSTREPMVHCVYDTVKEFYADEYENAKEVFEDYKAELLERKGKYCGRCGEFYKHLHFH